MTTKKRHCQHPSTSFSDALPFQSLPDLIGQSRAAAFISPDTPVKPHLAGEAIDGRGLSVITLFMSLPASLNVIARRSPLSVILRLDRSILKRDRK